MINSLRIRGLKGQAADATFKFKKYTFITGDNASGKSSLLTGVRSAMLGIVPESAIHCGSSDMVAQVELSDGTQLRTVAFTDKHKTTKHFLNGKAESKKSVNETRKRIFKMDPDIADTLTQDGQYCLELKPEKFSQLIGEFISKVDTEKIRHALAMSPEAEAEFGKMYSDPQISFDNIDVLYEKLSEKLRGLNKSIAADEQSAAFLKGTSSGASEETLRKQREFLQGKLEALKADDAKAKESKKICEERQKKLEEIDALQKALAVRPDTVPDGALQKAYEFQNSAHALLSEEKMNAACFERNIETIQKILDQLESSVCPISNKLVCTTDKTSIRADLEGSIEENKKMLAVHKNKIESLEISIRQASEAIAKYRKLEEEQRVYVATEEKMKLLKSSLPPVLPAPRPVDPLDIAALESQIEALNKDIANAANVEKAAKLLAGVAEQQKERDIITELREVFAPKGKAYNVILKAVCGALNSNINKTAKSLGIDREYEFRVDIGMTLFGKRTGEPEMFPVKNSSTGERFIAHLLILTMISEMNGLPFIIIDNLDCLDNTNVQKILRLVMSSEYETRFENVILAGVNHKDFCDVITALATSRTDVEVISLPITAAAGVTAVA